jgi:hypothetical protein
METKQSTHLELPTKFKHITLARIAFWLAVFCVPLYIIFRIVNFNINSISLNTFTNIFLASLAIISFIGMISALFIAAIGQRIKRHGYKQFRKSLEVWAKERYDIELDKKQILILSEPMSYSKKQTQYVSETIEKWVTDATGRKFLRHIALVETDEHPILFCLEEGSELESIEHKNEIEFFQNVWKEINTNEAIFALAQGTAFLGQEVNGQIAYLFWSDPLRVQLFSSENIDFELVAIMPQTWVEEILPVLTEQNALIGLNWGDEERSYPSPHIQKLIN